MSLTYSIPPAAPSQRSRKGRARPNLSRVCQKTKLCAFHLSGTCERAEACCFAHDPSELKPKPNLQGTKLCPMLIKTGHCSNNSCKFAHAESEVQAKVVENIAPSLHDTESMTERDTLSPTTTVLCRPVSTPLATAPVEQARPTDSPVASCLGAAAGQGALSFPDMVMHLTPIFMVVYQTQPETAKQVDIPASFPASAEDGTKQKMEPNDGHRMFGVASSSTLWLDSDTWSNVSTDEGHSDMSDGTLWSPVSDGSFSDDVSETTVRRYHSDVEVTVRNTFFHFEIPEDAPTSRRSRSMPSRPIRER